jgi:hypothetical protein
MKNPNIKDEKILILNLIKSLTKIYVTYCQKLDFEAFPQYSNEKLILENKE